eukprot:GHVP01068797.1.p1 GENE.GHVP01068797.1~~GHVP01068797.1.p1  ORF type:complete len:690 (+),score=86.28 GHVP01068797.1:1213-3282(+)
MGERSVQFPPQVHRWLLRKRLGGGSFGDIFVGVNKEKNETVAVKIEKTTSKYPQLMLEAKVYRALHGAAGVPRTHWYGVVDTWNVLVIDLLGPSLENVFAKNKRKMSVKSVVMIALQMLTRLELLHSRMYIHRDVKPDNFLIGSSNEIDNTFPTYPLPLLYMIDFGLSKRFKDAFGRHINYRDGKSLTGTARYASVNTHLGIEQSRRDDLEGLMYVLIYLLKGRLPWQGIKAERIEDKYKKIMKKKIELGVEELCEGCPSEFKMILKYFRSLKFASKPEYQVVRRLLNRILERELITAPGFRFDWNVQNSPSGAHDNSQRIPSARRPPERQQLRNVPEAEESQARPINRVSDNSNNNNNKWVPLPQFPNNGQTELTYRNEPCTELAQPRAEPINYIRPPVFADSNRIMDNIIDNDEQETVPVIYQGPFSPVERPSILPWANELTDLGLVKRMETERHRNQGGFERTSIIRHSTKNTKNNNLFSNSFYQRNNLFSSNFYQRNNPTLVSFNQPSTRFDLASDSKPLEDPIRRKESAINSINHPNSPAVFDPFTSAFASDIFPQEPQIRRAPRHLTTGPAMINTGASSAPMFPNLLSSKPPASLSQAKMTKSSGTPVSTAGATTFTVQPTPGPTIPLRKSQSLPKSRFNRKPRTFAETNTNDYKVQPAQNGRDSTLQELQAKISGKKWLGHV